MSYEALDVRTHDGVCTVTLNRPEKFNAMSLPMRRELGDCFHEIAADTDIKVVVLTGAGNAFSAGSDVNDFHGRAEEMHTLMGRISHRWFRAFLSLPQPVIAAVNGAAAGGGCNLALACDLVYASESAYFAQTFREIGLVPDFGGAFSIPRLVGLARAKEMAHLGERIDARKASEMNLIDGVFPAEQLMDEVERRALHIAARSAETVTMTKRMMNRSMESSLDSSMDSSMEAILDDELAAQSFLFGANGKQRGMERFLAMRRDRPRT